MRVSPEATIGEFNGVGRKMRVVCMAGCLGGGRGDGGEGRS